MIDLRSDTLTQPTANMRSAMAAAEVGDDVFGEDPTVRRLEEMAAARMGKAAALFVTSGTMANLIAIMVHCRRGDEILVGDQAHLFFYEQGGSASLAGVHPRSVANQPDGTLCLVDLEERIWPNDVHFPRSRVIALENTHNRCHGSPLSVEYVQSVVQLAGRHQLKVHVDGARIFNAAIAQNVTPAALTAQVDSVGFCLSKGLAAPVGSLLCGSSAFVAEARRVRKALGGGMRQAGVLAAAGIVALTEMVTRLDEDHRHAQRLAQRLSELPDLTVKPDQVKTNIVYAQIRRHDLAAVELVHRLSSLGVLVLAAAKDRIRAVTHYQIGSKDIELAADAFAQALRS